MVKRAKQFLDRNQFMFFIIHVRSKCMKILAPLGLHFGESRKSHITGLLSIVYLIQFNFFGCCSASIRTIDTHSELKKCETQLDICANKHPIIRGVNEKKRG